MTASRDEYPHLDPRIWQFASSDKARRIGIIEKDLFIEHDYSQYLNSVLEDYICGPRQTRMPCLLILGDAGMGKTAQLRRFQRQFPDSHDEDTEVLRLLEGAAGIDLRRRKAADELLSSGHLTID